MWMDKLERKIGRFAIPNLMQYVVFGTVGVLLISVFKPEFISYIVLTPDAIAKGQIWRFITFIFYPPVGDSYISMALSLYCYYWIGGALESTWGTFRFNIYYLSGMLITAISTMIFGGIAIPTYLNQMLFITLASLFPTSRVNFLFLIPMRAILLAAIGAGFMIYDYLTVGAILPFFRTLILSAVLNYLLFIAPTIIQHLKYRKRRSDYMKKAQSGATASKAKSAVERRDSDRGKIIKGVPFHKCHVCGITDVDDPDMTFRYCSQCNGNYEYCENHLHNHEHVK